MVDLKKIYLGKRISGNVSDVHAELEPALELYTDNSQPLMVGLVDADVVHRVERGRMKLLEAPSRPQVDLRARGRYD